MYRTMNSTRRVIARSGLLLRGVLKDTTLSPSVRDRLGRAITETEQALTFLDQDLLKKAQSEVQL